MKRAFLPLVAAFLFLPFVSGLRAQEIPTYSTLPCEKGCPQFTPAKSTSRPRINFTSEQIVAGEEGAVTLSLTVGTDGRAKNIVVEQVVGSASFVQNAKEQALDTTFEPASENGKPVEENKQYRYFFRINPPRQHPKAVQAYHDALSQAALADKIAALKAIQNNPELSLYETTMVAGVTAQFEADAGDDRAALRDIEVATLNNGEYLDKKVVEQAFRLQIVLDAHEGQYGDAFSTFETLKKLKGVTVTESDPEAQLISRLHSEIASSKPLWASAEIAEDGGPAAGWHHIMLRRSFGFANIKGSLSSFDLKCEAHGIASPISDSATWTIPPSWTKCNILVEGTPGTTFKFGEAQPDTASAPTKPN